MTVTKIQILLEGLALKNGGRAKMCREAQEALQLLVAECGAQETLNAVNALLGAEAAEYALQWVLEGSKLPQEVKPTPADTVVIPGVTPIPPAVPADQIDPAKVKWLDADVSKWPITTDLKISFGGGNIVYGHSKSRVWSANEGLNANPWILVPTADGKWLAATWEWMKVGQTAKPAHKIEPGHVKQDAMTPLLPPKSGQTYGFLVSGLARDKKRGSLERSPIVLVRWP